MSWTKLITAGFITEMNDQVSGGMEIKKTNKQTKKKTWILEAGCLNLDITP